MGTFRWCIHSSNARWNPPPTVLLKLSICSSKIKLIANSCRYSKYDLQCTDILVVKITAPSDILEVMTMKKNVIFKIIKPFLMFTVSLFVHVAFMGSLRVWNLYTLINLAYCWIYCKLKLHSSPNTISFTVEIIWNYFLTLLICL